MPRYPLPRLHDGQLYRAVSLREDRTGAGKLMRIITWQSRCPDCGRLFTFESAIGFPKYPRRRCDECKSPDKPPVALTRRHKPLRYRNNGRRRRATMTGRRTPWRERV